jgi:hypothetical protein
LRKTALILLFSAVAITPSVTEAAEFEITPFIGYQFGGDVTTVYQGQQQDVSVSSSENFGIVLSLGLSEYFQLELLYNTQDTSADAKRFDDSLGLGIDYWQIGMLWGFDPDAQVNPYFVLGLGGAWLSPEGFSNFSRFSGSIGAGAKIFFSESIGLRLEGRFYATHINNDSIYCDPLWCYGWPNRLYQFDVSAGLIIRLGD